MTRERMLILAVAGGLALLIVSLLLYLTLSDLSGWRDTVARVASNAMDRELTIDGEFKVDFGIVTRVRATELSLANTEWGSEPKMATIDRLDGEINLWELLSGSIHLPTVSIEGGRAIFESDAEAGSNWQLGKGDDTGDDTKDTDPVRLRIDRIRGSGVTLVFGSTTDEDHVGLVVESLDSTGDAEGMHQLTGGGSLHGAEFTLSGRFGSFADLINLAPFDHDLRGTLGSTELRSAGTIGRIATLGDLDLEAEATIPNPTEIYQLLGLSYTFEHPLEIQAEATPASGLTEFTLTATGEAADLSASGTVDSMISPADLDVRIGFAGPDIGPIAALAGIGDLAEEPFSLSGRFQWHGFPVQVSDLEIRIGANRVSADGRLGAPPLMLGTDFRVNGAGPDVASVAALAGVRLPHDSYELEGQLLRVENGLEIIDVNATIGRTSLTTSGFVGDPPEYDGTELIFDTKGPNLAHFNRVLGIELPAESFRIRGRLADGGEAIALREVEARIGRDRLTVDGLITRKNRFVGTKLDIEATGSDLSTFGDLVPPVTLPNEAFRVAGKFELLNTGFGLRGVELWLGQATGSVEGRIGEFPTFEGTDLRIEAHGPSLAVIDSLVRQINLPAAEFSVAGDASFANGTLELRDMTIAVADNTASISGTVVPGNGFTGSTAEIALEGSDLRSLGILVEDSIALGLPDFPAHPYSLTGVIAIDESGTQIESFEASLGAATMSVTGIVGAWPGLVGTDLEVDADGPDASLFAATTGVSIPVAPFQLTGRVSKEETGFRFDNVRAQIGDYRAELDGTLGNLPKLIGTNLSVRVEGPDLELLRELTKIEKLTNESFLLAGIFVGNPQRFKTSALEIRLGSSDISGDVRVDLGGKPRFTGRLQSGHVVLSDLLPHSEEAKIASDQETEAEKPPSRFVIADDPWDLAFLDRIDMDLDWDIDELEYLLNTGRDIELSVLLDNGRVKVDRLRGTGAHGGKLRGSASLTPVAEGHRLVTEFHIDDGMLNLAGETADSSQYTPVDFHLDLSATGKTPHEMAASANGRVSVTVAEGILEKGILDMVSADFLVTLLNALNPFAKQDTYTRLNCAVLVANFEDGLMTLKPAAIQTDKVTVLGDGTLDFKTEDLRLDWITKPRKGIGISASMFTNPYIRLGGTLSEPAIEMKPAEALATTGIAVATMGISLVAKGMLDRITAEKKVCERALKDLEKME